MRTLIRSSRNLRRLRALGVTMILATAVNMAISYTGVLDTGKSHFTSVTLPKPKAVNINNTVEVKSSIPAVTPPKP